MKNRLYRISMLLVIAWVIGFVGFHAKPLIHLLLIIAVIAALFGAIKNSDQNY